MKKLFFILTALISCSVLTAQQVIKDVNAQAREAKGFHAIKVSSSFDVYLTQSNEEGLAVSANNEKYIDNIKTEVKDGVLHIWFQNTGNIRWGNRKLKAYISFKQIDRIDVSGACDVEILGTWKAEDVNIELSGASDMGGKIEAKKLSFNLNGASDIKLLGSASEVNIEANGASSFKGFDFAVDYCNAKVSGASDIKITVNKELSAKASGASEIRYKGEGLIRDVKTSGASSISKV